MGATWGWALAVLAVAMGWVQWGWQGVVLAVTVIVFWLLLQFSRALRVMRQAGAAPVGHVGSAVMLHARLRRGMRLMEVIPIARSLGRAVEAAPGAPGAPGAANGLGGLGGLASLGAREAFEWRDPSGAAVRVQLVGGRVTSWALERSQTQPDPPEGPPAAPV